MRKNTLKVKTKFISAQEKVKQGFGKYRLCVSIYFFRQISSNPVTVTKKDREEGGNFEEIEKGNI